MILPSYTDALSACSLQGGLLAKMKNSRVNAAATNLLQPFDIVWIGAICQTQGSDPRGRFVWKDGGGVVDDGYSNFDTSGDPTGGSIENLQCNAGTDCLTLGKVTRAISNVYLSAL
jgi:hypothetical protein